MELDHKQMQEAVDILKEGGVVVFPTETSYGMAVDATNHDAVARVMKLKARPDHMPLALIVKDLEMARWCGTVDPELEQFTERHWPGPLTIVVPDANMELSLHCLRDDTVGLRVSSHPVAQALVHGLGKPIIATSANVHGQPAAYTVAEAKAQFAGKEDEPDMYLDGGTLDEVPPSMIIELVNGEVVVHRQGSFKLTEDDES